MTREITVARQALRNAGCRLHNWHSSIATQKYQDNRPVAYAELRSDYVTAYMASGEEIVLHREGQDVWIPCGAPRDAWFEQWLINNQVPYTAS